MRHDQRRAVAETKLWLSMTREEITAKAATHAQRLAGNYKVAGSTKFRDAALVCFRCEGYKALRIEIVIDTKTGECLQGNFIPSGSAIYSDDRSKP